MRWLEVAFAALCVVLAVLLFCFFSVNLHRRYTTYPSCKEWGENSVCELYAH